MYRHTGLSVAVTLHSVAILITFSKAYMYCISSIHDYAFVFVSSSSEKRPTVCMAVIKYGLYGCSLAATSIPIMTEESISLLFHSCVDKFVCEQHVVQPAKGLSAIHHRGADKQIEIETYRYKTIFRQCFFFISNIKQAENHLYTVSIYSLSSSRKHYETII